ncbi:MAG TPA: rRNA adenine dimethyltransferase family protein, partial [bacterium]|nr:rRNA adenine dimethyltransferase family protein [bacterium]
ARQVFAVELDDGYCDFMVERFGAPCVAVQDLRDAAKPIQGHIVVIRGSAMSFDPGWVAEERRGIVVYGNLPYCETTPILVHLLEHRRHIDRMLLLVQKEVGERIVAHPGAKDKAYGKLSVMVQTYFEPALLMDISPTVFLPRPEVRSAFLSLVTRENPFGHLGSPLPDDFPEFLHRVVFQAFAKRRKMLRTLMPEGWPSVSAEDWNRVFADMGIDSSRRGESLSPQMFHRMALTLYGIVYGSER